MDRRHKHGDEQQGHISRAIGIAVPAPGSESADPVLHTSTIPSTGAADTPDVTDAAARSTASASSRLPPASSETRAKGKGKKEHQKGLATAASSSATGSRFQCPKCPKSFSRIENLTRHQANHDEVAKFNCPVCKKRFTRSDLLNRHRRIHGNAEAAYPAQSHILKSDAAPIQTPIQDYPHNTLPEIVPQQLESQPNVSYSEQIPLPQTPATFQGPLAQVPYQQPILTLHEGLPISEQLNLLNNPLPTHGLSDLADAALTSGMGNAVYDLQLQQPNNPNSHSPWAGFMLGDAAPSNYNGSYDANISWTFPGFNQESPPNDMIGYEDIINPPSHYAENTYRPQIAQVEQSATEPDEHEDDDADTKDWPDKPASVVVGDRTLSIPYRLLASSWHPAVLEEARRSNATSVRIIPHRITPEIRTNILNILNSAHLHSKMSNPEIRDAAFPSPEVLDLFLQLYLQHIHPRFPVVHIPTFNIFDSHPLLLVTMMFLGSCQSKADRGRFWRLFHDHARFSFVRCCETDDAFLRPTDHLFIFFLLCIGLAWSGSHRSYEFAEGSRGILITAVRRSRLFDCRAPELRGSKHLTSVGNTPAETEWLSWVEMEKRKRVGIAVYIYDSQYPALFNNQGYISKSETTNCSFPCAEEFWEARTAEDWKRILGPDATEPPTVFYLQALNTCLFSKYLPNPPPYPQLSEYGKFFLLYALHTHIFEWRQSTIMYNPTGIKGILENLSYTIGKSLVERRKWLTDTLDTWFDAYQSPQITPAALILLHLAYISLDVSLSDLHLMAGRGSSSHDQLFAQENLRQWANSEGAIDTINHVYTMLNICHQCIASGIVAPNSFELTVGLFTGGLVCWAYGQFRNGIPAEEYMQQVSKASQALRGMNSWMMCTNFGGILNEGFKVARNTG